MLDIKECLTWFVRNDGSDLYLTFGAPPIAKIQGQFAPFNQDRLTREAIIDIARQILGDVSLSTYQDRMEFNTAIDYPGIGRFRANFFVQKNEPAAVIRNIKTEVPSSDTIGLPDVLKDVVASKNGLILFVGATGSGKSTSLAALIDHRNATSSGHILTVEDPIEYLHFHKKSLVSQREIGIDTKSYEEALKNALRQAPDVILVGEIRTREAMEYALKFAESGHLCLSTLHANNADQALGRIVNFFPEDRHPQLRMDLSLNLRAIVSQRLVPSMDGRRCASFEILLGTPLVGDLLRKGDLHSIKEVMAKSENIGMRTFDGDLFRLWSEKRISRETALQFADSANNVRLRMDLGSADGHSLLKNNGFSLVSMGENEEQA